MVIKHKQNYTVSGFINNYTSVSNDDIIIDIVHPAYFDWLYPQVMARRKLTKSCQFNFDNVKPGRVTMLRVYSIKRFEFFKGLGLFWDNWFKLLNFSTLKHWNEEKNFLRLYRYFYYTDVYYVAPLLRYENNIEINIYPENTQDYYPSWTEYIGEFAYEDEINDTNHVKDIINRLLLECQKENKAEEILDFELYKKKYGNEVYCIGSKWMNDKNIIIMPLTNAVE